MSDFVHLAVRTAAGRGFGTAEAVELAQRAANLGMPALALTDRNSLAGMVPFVRATRDAGVRPIIGVTLDVFERDATSAEVHRQPVRLLARDPVGYRRICELLGDDFSWPKLPDHRIAHPTWTEMAPDLPAPDNGPWLHHLLARPAGLTMLVGSLGSRLASLLLDDRETQAQQWLAGVCEAFGREHVFLELADHGLPAQSRLAARLVALGKVCGCRVVASNDVHYVEADDAPMHDLFLAARHHVRCNHPHRPRLPSAQFWLKSEDEMRQALPDCTEALSNTSVVAEQCRWAPSLDHPRLPALGGHDLAALEQRCAAALRPLDARITQRLVERLSREFDQLQRFNGAGLMLAWQRSLAGLREHGGMTDLIGGDLAPSATGLLLKLIPIPVEQFGSLQDPLFCTHRAAPELRLEVAQGTAAAVIRQIAGAWTRPPWLTGPEATTVSQQGSTSTEPGGTAFPTWVGVTRNPIPGQWQAVFHAIGHALAVDRPTCRRLLERLERFDQSGKQTPHGKPESAVDPCDPDRWRQAAKGMPIPPSVKSAWHLGFKRLRPIMAWRAARSNRVVMSVGVSSLPLPVEGGFPTSQPVPVVGLSDDDVDALGLPCIRVVETPLATVLTTASSAEPISTDASNQSPVWLTLQDPDLLSLAPTDPVRFVQLLTRRQPTRLDELAEVLALASQPAPSGRPAPAPRREARVPPRLHLLTQAWGLIRAASLKTQDPVRFVRAWIRTTSD